MIFKQVTLLLKEIHPHAIHFPFFSPPSESKLHFILMIFVETILSIIKKYSIIKTISQMRYENKIG